MKLRSIRSWVLTLALAAGLIPCSMALGAQNQNERQQPPGAQQQPPSAQQQPPEAQQPSENQPKTYTGKIVKTKTGKYALLTDPQAGKGFFLDNQQEAQKYEEKNVKIVATLDTHTMVLHIINIQLAS